MDCTANWQSSVAASQEEVLSEMGDRVGYSQACRSGPRAAYGCNKAKDSEDMHIT